ncbi:MAG TPA: hypothetical protein VFH47_06485 [Candidatus Thermoplasmatota archaeon]|nr:hypothetical protein [Candidatus Thermoplasmatota archaeon]
MPMARNTQSNASTEFDADEVIDVCYDAYQSCREVINHCFDNLDEVEPEHLKLFLDGSMILGCCVEVCGRNSALYEEMCHLTAVACKACEEACEEYEGESVFDDAQEAFRACYETLVSLAGGEELPGWDEEGEQVGEVRRGSKSEATSRGGRSNRGSPSGKRSKRVTA